MNEFSENTDIVVLPIGKILIVRNKNKKEFYKLNDDICEKLNEEEERYIHQIFNAPRSSIIYEESAWDIANKNSNFGIDENGFWETIIKSIDEIIPEGAKDNFYRNIQSVQFDYKDDLKNDESEFMVPADYNAMKNKIRISRQYFDYIKCLNEKGVDTRKNILGPLIHEMLHMASTKYDKERGVISTGFDIFEDTGKSIASNRGLTEGMTEMLEEQVMTKIIGNNTYVNDYTAYKKETLIAKQLRMLIPDDLRKEYFMANGDSVIKDKMKEYIPSEEDLDVLFDRIEDGFILRKCESLPDYRTTIHTNVQQSLISAFERKIENNIENGIIDTGESLEEYMGIFEKFMLSYSSNMLSDPNTGLDVGRVQKSFDEIKKRKMQTLALKYPDQNLDVIITSPMSGSEVERREDGTYYCEAEDITYVVNKEGKLVKLENASMQKEDQENANEKIQSVVVARKEVIEKTQNVKSSEIDKEVSKIRQTVTPKQAPRKEVNSPKTEQEI